MDDAQKEIDKTQKENEKARKELEDAQKEKECRKRMQTLCDVFKPESQVVVIVPVCRNHCKSVLPMV
jgi:FMN-dependent NADH-azoreductase